MQKSQTSAQRGPLPSYTSGASCLHKAEPSAAQDCAQATQSGKPSRAFWHYGQWSCVAATAVRFGAASSPLSMKTGRLLSKPFASWGYSGTSQRSFHQDGLSLSKTGQWLIRCLPWVLGRCGVQPLVFVCGICSPDVHAPAGIHHFMSALCEHAFYKLHPLVNPKYVAFRGQLRRLLHIGQPSQRVLELAREKTEAAPPC